MNQDMSNKSMEILQSHRTSLHLGFWVKLLDKFNVFGLLELMSICLCIGNDCEVLCCKFCWVLCRFYALYGASGGFAFMPNGFLWSCCKLVDAAVFLYLFAS